MATDVNTFIVDLNAGVFEQTLSEAISLVASSVVNHKWVLLHGERHRCHTL